MNRVIENPEKLSPSQVMENYWRDPIEVKHGDLKRSGDSAFRSVCPVCGRGHLLMRRNVSNGMKLQMDDNCTMCGTRFVYTDLVEDVTIVYKKEETDTPWEYLLVLAAAALAILAMISR